MAKKILLSFLSLIFSIAVFGCTSQSADEDMTIEDMHKQFYVLHEKHKSDEEHSAYSGLVLEMVRLAIRLEGQVDDENIGNILNEYSGYYSEFPCYVGKLKNGNEIIAFSSMQYNNEYLYEDEVNNFRGDENEMAALNPLIVIWESIDRSYHIEALDIYIGGERERVKLDVVVNGEYSPYRDLKESEEVKPFLKKYNKKLFEKNKGFSGDWNYCLFKFNFDEEWESIMGIYKINVIVNDEIVELKHIYEYMRDYNGTYAEEAMQWYKEHI